MRETSESRQLQMFQRRKAAIPMPFAYPIEMTNLTGGTLLESGHWMVKEAPNDHLYHRWNHGKDPSKGNKGTTERNHRNRLKEPSNGKN